MKITTVELEHFVQDGLAISLIGQDTKDGLTKVIRILTCPEAEVSRYLANGVAYEVEGMTAHVGLSIDPEATFPEPPTLVDQGADGLANDFAQPTLNAPNVVVFRHPSQAGGDHVG